VGETHAGWRAGLISATRTADPRLTQGAFLVPVAALFAVFILVDPARLGHAPVLVGGGLVVLATLLAILARGASVLAFVALLVVPALDLAAIAALRQVPSAGVVAALLVFPSIWLGLAFRRLGVLLATAGSVVALSLPGFAIYGFGLDGWIRAVVLPIIAAMAALSTSLSADAWNRQRRQLELQGEDLERLVRETTQHRQLTEAIVNAVDVGLLAIDRHGTYNSMNPRHREFMRIGYPDGHSGRAGAIGYAFTTDQSTLLEPEDMPAVRAARGESIDDFTMWIGKEPAERRALSVSARPIFDETGAFDGAVLAYKDITDLMQALQVKDDFVASVSHELRTPLTSILGYTDLILERADELPEDLAAQLGVVRRNADRLLLLVSDLLSTAQIESRTMRLVPEPTDLAGLLHQCLDQVTPRAAAAGVRVHRSVAETPPVLVDPSRIAQVVDNLLTNAVKYTEAGGAVRVSLCLRGADADAAEAAEAAEAHEAHEVVLTVADTGIGIAPEDLERIFTKFFRADSAEQRAIPGVGLGLSICRAIVEAHAGTIELDSTEGVGTTARVRLPTAAG
jgi:signal transduction histidine kinase